MYPESIQHTSIYFLEYEHTYPKDWVHRSLSREAQYLEYTEIVDYLVNQGFHHYEVSNFARPGYESCHNKGYWNHSEAIGFGLSAASYTEGQRYQNSVDFASYYRGQKSDEILSPEDIRIEKIMF